jgi:hypothetical protein
MISCASQAVNLANKNELGHPRGFSKEEQAKQLIIRDVANSTYSHFSINSNTPFLIPL